MTFEELEASIARSWYNTWPILRIKMPDGSSLGWWLRYGIKNKITDIPFHVRMRFNRAVHGYDQIDWWEYKSTNSRRAVKLLTLLRDRGNGCPGAFGCKDCLDYMGRDGDISPWDCSCKPFDRWKDALSDMIFFHQQVVNDQLDMSPEDRYRYRKGKLLYMKWYEALWD